MPVDRNSDAPLAADVRPPALWRRIDASVGASSYSTTISGPIAIFFFFAVVGCAAPITRGWSGSDFCSFFLIGLGGNHPTRELLGLAAPLYLSTRVRVLNLPK